MTTTKRTHIRIGNTYEPLPGKVHNGIQTAFRWKMYALPLDSSHPITHVTYELHPSPDGLVQVNEAPFILERIGWSAFEVKVTLHAGDRWSHTLKWMLQTTKENSSRDYQLEVPVVQKGFDLDSVELGNSEGLNYAADHDPFLAMNVLNEQGTEDITEYQATEERLDLCAQKVAYLLKHSKHCVVYTGAGISTSAAIPDYRGPSGAWKYRDGSCSDDAKMDFEQATPTYSHYAIAELVKRGMVKYVVSTNLDGLHRRSGIEQHQISELHGNCFREMCIKCNKEYLRSFDTTNAMFKSINSHLTGRLCDCGGMLKDTITRFSEPLPEKELTNALLNSVHSDFALILGSSMRVQPSCSLPPLCKQQNGKMVIVNLQKTPYDHVAFLKVYSKIDDFMLRVMRYLGLEQVDTSYDMLTRLVGEENEAIEELLNIDLMSPGENGTQNSWCSLSQSTQCGDILW